MDDRDAGPTGQQTLNLIRILTALNEIETSINRLGMGYDLTLTLRLIVDNAVRAVAATSDCDGPLPNASAIIWVYDEVRQDFDRRLRVSAGEPEGASIDDFPRPDGLGRRAIRAGRRLLSYEEGIEIHPAKQAAGASSLVCYPLIVRDEAVGILYVYRCDERPFSDIELLMLDNFVNLAAMAIHHGRQLGDMSRALERKVKELEKLHWASQLISSRTNLADTFQEILNIGLEITAAQYGSFELYDKEKNVLVIVALAGRKKSPATPAPLPLNERSVVGWVALHKRSALIGDSLQDSYWRTIYHPLPIDGQMRSEVAVPLISAGNRLEGVLNIESPLPNSFGEDDLHLLEMLATQAVVALQEIRLLDAMQEIAEVLLTADEDELLKLITDRACELINASVGSIWTTSDTKTLVLQQSTEGYKRAKSLPLDDSLTGQAIRLRRPITIDDVRVSPEFKYRGLAVEQGWVSAIVVPMITPGEGGQALGCFSLYYPHLHNFSDWDKKLLTCLADYAAIAIQNAKGVAELKQVYGLSEREREVLTLLIQGQTNKEIAERLMVSVNTVKKHVQSIFAKLDVESRAAAVAKALGQEQWDNETMDN